jgi:hypothetical protein
MEDREHPVAITAEARLTPRPPSFWKLQLIGWSVYFVVIYVTFLTVSADDKRLDLLHVKVVRSVIGFALSSLLRVAYRPAARAWSLRRQALLAVVGSILLGCVWTTTEELYFWTIRPGYRLDPWLRRMPIYALDYAITLLGWSAL